MVLASRTIDSPLLTWAAASGTDGGLLVALQAVAHIEGDVAAAHADGDGATVRADDPIGFGQHLEVLADGHRRDAEALGQLADARAALLLDDAGDLPLPLAGEGAARRAGPTSEVMPPRLGVAGRRPRR